MTELRARSTKILGCLALLAVAQAHAQPPASAPQLKFEAVSVKVHPMTPYTYLIKNFPHEPPFVVPTGAAFTDTAHVQDLIMEAYGLNSYQVLYLPWWASAQRGTAYDIEAKAKDGTIPTPVQMQQMLQNLLADRFHLKAHWETKPKFSVYALVVDKTTPKFQEFHGDVSKAAAAGEQPFAGTTLFALARFLTQNLDSPVVDRTGLAAVPYDFDIDRLVDYREVDREEALDPAQAQQYLRTAVQHQLGLRLDSRKESTQFLAIDHIEEPPQN